MGFKNGGGKKPRTHSWSNNPDRNHQVCTKCGVHKEIKKINNKSTVIYYLKDGLSTIDCPNCVGKSIYDKLIEEL